MFAKFLFGTFIVSFVVNIGCTPENVQSTSPKPSAKVQAVLDRYQELGRQVDPYLKKLQSLSEEKRQALWRDVAVGNLKSFNDFFGVEAGQAQVFLDMVRKVEGDRPGEYPSVERLTLLYGAWAKHQNFTEMAATWMKPALPGFSMRYQKDLTFPDDSSAVQGQTVKKVWEVRNAGDADWPKGLQLELVLQYPEKGAIPPKPVPIPALRKGEVGKVEIDFIIYADAPIGPWKAYFVTTGMVNGRRQYLKPRLGLLLSSADNVVAMGDLLNAKLNIRP